MNYKRTLAVNWRVKKNYWRNRYLDACHSNRVLQKAIDDVCSGRVTLDSLKQWVKTGANPKIDKP